MSKRIINLSEISALNPYAKFKTTNLATEPRLERLLKLESVFDAPTAHRYTAHIWRALVDEMCKKRTEA